MKNTPYFKNGGNRKTTLLILFSMNIFSFLISLVGMMHFSVKSGSERIAFVGNLFLACFTILFSIIMIVYMLVLYLKQHNNDSKIFELWDSKKLMWFFLIFYIFSIAILVCSFIVFSQRNDVFAWYNGWWRNFGQLL